MPNGKLNFTVVGKDFNSRSFTTASLAWRLQATAEGGLSERAKRRIEELADDAEIRLTPPKNSKSKVSTVGSKSPDLSTGRDKRLPPPGLCIQRVYKDRVIQVIVLADGFELDGKKYKSLSAIAKSITGSQVNGFHFFQLGSSK